MTKELSCDAQVNFCSRFPTLVEIGVNGSTRLNCPNLNANLWKNCKNLKTIFLPKNQFEKIDDEVFDEIPQIEKIYLQENQIRTIGPKAFRNLISLTVLQFDDNKIEEIHRDVFISNFKLEDLFLANNLISELHPDLFRSLVYLKFLDLSNNRIKVLHTSLFKNVHFSLNFLYLRNNKISAVQKGCFNRTLTYFDFLYNECVDLKLNGLPVKEIDEKLETCYENYLNENIKTLKCEFGEEKLKGNFGCTLTDAEVLITKNYTFYISSTNFVPNSYNDDEVKALVIQKSTFDFVPSKFCETFINLQSLKASKVGIFTWLNSIENCTNLYELDLSRNLIKTIEIDSFSSLIHLKAINLEANKIENLADSLFSTLSELESLNIGDNFITEISVHLLKPLKNLQDFSAHQNFLTEIDEIFQQNREMKTVNLEANEISSVNGGAFKSLAKLSTLNFKGNDCAHKVYNSLDFSTNIEKFLSNCNKIYCIFHCGEKAKLEL